VVSLRFLRSRKMWKGERISFTINEFFEKIGGLINAIEKLIMPFIVFFSFRLFWLYIIDESFTTQPLDS
jgi:hypothetical protein